MPVLMQIAVGLVFLYLFATVLIFIFQRRLMYNPNQAVNTPHRNQSPAFEKITLTTADGLKLKSFYKAPSVLKNGDLYPTILYMHGNTGTAGDAAHKLIPMADAGYGLLLLEYRGYGGNPGIPDEKGLIADAESALHFIHLKQGKHARVVYYGMSMGTGVANGLAAKRPPAGLILECGFTSMTRAAQAHYPMFPVKYLIKDSYDSKTRILSLRAPLLILHGEKDKTVPIQHAREMFDSARTADKMIKVYPEGRHIDLYDFGSSDDIVDWLNEKYFIE